MVSAATRDAIDTFLRLHRHYVCSDAAAQSASAPRVASALQTALYHLRPSWAHGGDGGGGGERRVWLQSLVQESTQAVHPSLDFVSAVCQLLHEAVIPAATTTVTQTQTQTQAQAQATAPQVTATPVPVVGGRATQVGVGALLDFLQAALGDPLLRDAVQERLAFSLLDAFVDLLQALKAGSDAELWRPAERSGTDGRALARRLTVLQAIEAMLDRRALGYPTQRVQGLIDVLVDLLLQGAGHSGGGGGGASHTSVGVGTLAASLSCLAALLRANAGVVHHVRQHSRYDQLLVAATDLSTHSNIPVAIGALACTSVLASGTAAAAAAAALFSDAGLVHTFELLFKVLCWDDSSDGTLQLSQHRTAAAAGEAARARLQRSCVDTLRSVLRSRQALTKLTQSSQLSDAVAAMQHRVIQVLLRDSRSKASSAVYPSPCAAMEALQELVGNPHHRQLRHRTAALLVAGGALEQLFQLVHCR